MAARCQTDPVTVQPLPHLTESVLRPVRGHHAFEACVEQVATAIRLGRTIASHEIVVTDEDGRRLCTARITNLIIDAPDR